MDAMNIQVELMRKVEELEIEGFSSMGEFTDAERLAIVQEIERITVGRFSSDPSVGSSSVTALSDHGRVAELQPLV